MSDDLEFITDRGHPKMQAAIREMQDLILAHYPDAVFKVGYGDSPYGVYLDATVDVDDTEDVEDLYIDRLLELQLRDRLAFHVIPLHTPERNAAIWREQRRAAEAVAAGAAGAS